MNKSKYDNGITEILIVTTSIMTPSVMDRFFLWAHQLKDTPIHPVLAVDTSAQRRILATFDEDSPPYSNQVTTSMLGMDNPHEEFCDIVYFDPSYRSWIWKTLKPNTIHPGSHDQVIYWLHKHRDFWNRFTNLRYYWMFDNDVYVNGDIYRFLEQYHNVPADLLAPHIQTESTHANYWFDHKDTQIFKKEIGYSKLTRCFGNILRLDVGVVPILSAIAVNKPPCHYEVKVPSILANIRGRRVVDIATGVPGIKYVDKHSFFYLEDQYPVDLCELEFKEHHLYHPMKF